MTPQAFGTQLRLWPVHPQPEADELLSSWIMRLAHGNGFKAHAFCRAYLGADFEWGALDLDRSVNKKTLATLAERTGNTIEKLEPLTLRSHAQHVVERMAENASSAWILSLGRRGRLSTLPGLMFCPECFREDKEPYLRRNWRMGWTTVCTRHRCMLLDRCPSCSSCLQPHRVDRSSKYALDSVVSQASCAHCRVNLRRYMERTEVNEANIQRQFAFEQAAQEGWAEVPGHSSVHSIAYFAGIRAIAQLILRQRDAPGLAGLKKGRPIEQLDVATRHAVLGEVWQTLESWPHGFIKRCAGYKAPFTALKQDRTTLPWWLHSVCEQHLRRDALKVAPGEADYIAALVIKTDGRFTHTGSRRLTRRDLYGHKAPVPPAMTRSDLDWFFARLDQQISQSEGDERRDLLRDKAMFMTAKTMGLSQDRLRHMRISDCPQPSIDWYDTDFSQVPADAAQLEGWLSWYLTKVRPDFPLATSVPWMFPQRWKPKPISQSMVWQRFSRSLEQAELKKRIPNYKHWVAASVVEDNH